jgi:hypothetical protein
VYSVQPPRCPYDEIAHLEGSRRFFWNSQASVLDQIRAKAGELGADAVVLVDSRAGSNGGWKSRGLIHDVTQTGGYSAAAIHFRSTACAD